MTLSLIPRTLFARLSLGLVVVLTASALLHAFISVTASRQHLEKLNQSLNRNLARDLALGRVLGGAIEVIDCFQESARATRTILCRGRRGESRSVEVSRGHSRSVEVIRGHCDRIRDRHRSLGAPGRHRRWRRVYP